MNRRIVFGTLAAVALLLAACGTSSGTSGSKAQKEEPPLTGANFKYELNEEGGITITEYINIKGNGIRNFIIPAQIDGLNVTQIGWGAFAQFSYGQMQGSGGGNTAIGFENVTIPSTVVSIGPNAFLNRAIKTLTLPEGIKTIGEGAFANNELTSVIVPSSTNIEERAFDSGVRIIRR
jgi:hypothetical protein